MLVDITNDPIYESSLQIFDCLFHKTEPQLSSFLDDQRSPN